MLARKTWIALCLGTLLTACWTKSPKQPPQGSDGVTLDLSGVPAAPYGSGLYVNGA